jgi:hypothetical protein
MFILKKKRKQKMKTLKTLLFILICAASYTGCSENQNNLENSSLTGTKWKLTGFVTNGDAKTPVPDSNDCYWLLFKDDNTLEGKSSTNFLSGSYEIDRTSSLLITNLGGTKINELFDGKFFVESLAAVRSFDLQEDALKLYYNETDYLLFTVFPVEIEPVLIGKGDLHPAGFTEPNTVINRIITSEEEWNELKTTMREKGNTLMETDIDFSACQVIAIFDEIHGTNGWSIDITGIVEYSDRIVVSVTNLQTGAGGGYTVLTQPYHIVKIPVSAKEIVFQKEDDGHNGEPKEVSFTEYSLAKTSCQWTKTNNNDEVVVINSNEAFTQYVTCTGNDYSAIDFSKYTLLLAHGLASSSIVSVNCNRLQKFSEQNYRMNVDIVLGDATVMSNWQTPIIINKLSEGCTIELTVTIK